MTKTYFWLKLQNNFFDKEEIKLIETMPNGYKYINFYLKLLLKSIETEGTLLFRNIIPYTPEMLSSITNTDIDTVKVASDLFIKLGLMDKLKDGSLFMNEVNKMIGKETSEAVRKRQYRAKLEHKSGTLSLSCPTEIEIEKDIELEKEIDKDKEINKDNEDKSSNVAIQDKNELFKTQIKSFVDRWNDFADRVDVPKIIVFNKKREKEFKNRIEDAGSLDNMISIISRNWDNSSFLTGKTSANFKFNIDFVLRQSNFLKMMEGNYIDKNKKGNW